MKTEIQKKIINTLENIIKDNYEVYYGPCWDYVTTRGHRYIIELEDNQRDGRLTIYEDEKYCIAEWEDSLPNLIKILKKRRK